MAKFPISRDPPEGGTGLSPSMWAVLSKFPISRDPPEGGTHEKNQKSTSGINDVFPISRDPPEGGTLVGNSLRVDG